MNTFCVTMSATRQHFKKGMKMANLVKKEQLEFDLGSLTPEAQSYVMATAAVKRKAKKGTWRGMIAVPPGSLIESVINEFKNNTNIALEIPFATFMHYVAGLLIHNKIQIDFNGALMDADFWTIVLSNSGGGKTWTEKEIRKGLESAVPRIESGAASAAQWLAELAENPHGLWVKDEIYQLLRNIETAGSPLAEMKDYLLRAYDNAEITRTTKKDAITVKHPVLSILGFNALAPFVNGMSGESLVDGFAQRFSYVLARPDPTRKMADFPVWKVNTEGWRERFAEMVTGLHPVYKTGHGAEQAFVRAFKEHAHMDLDESFYRRVMWRAHKYALIYHIMRGAAADPVLTDEDYGWAARLTEIQLADAADVIQMCTKTDIGKAIDAADALVKKLREKGKPVTARAIVSGTRLISTVGMARMVLSILNVQPE